MRTVFRRRPAQTVGEPSRCTCPGACGEGMGALGVWVAILVFNAFFFGLLVLAALLPGWLR